MNDYWVSSNQALKDFLKVVGELILISLIAIGLLYLGWRYGGVGLTKQDYFQKVYKRCIAQEILSQEQCYNLALNEAYPGTPLIEIER